ncbi:MAG: AIPR family protein [Ruminococcus sp.]|nr:AIPR family protein [Ruminococcus sp.]
MALTKYESYYNSIKTYISEIRKDNEYNNDSLAFAHWYLKNHFNLSDQQVSEAIIDGADDLGIDAIIFDDTNNSLYVFQFKFPSKSDNTNSEIVQGDILKTFNGFNTLIDNGIPYLGTNTRFRDFKEQINDTFIDEYKMFFVSFNKGIIANETIIDNNKKLFKNNYGNDLNVIIHNRDVISSIYEKINRKNNITISLKYKQIQSAYNVASREIDSYVGFVNCKDLVSAIKENISTIFDENIRLYEYNSTVNNGIYRTATSSSESDMFYFYNNGIVFICDKTRNSPASNEIILEGASVVNGCQSLNVLYNAHNDEKLSDDACVLIRIIQIADFNQRRQITEFLNSQTPIRDSYFISNHHAIRNLQEQLLKKGYFLERQINEYKYKKEHGDSLSYGDDIIVLQLEEVLQYFTGYWINNSASAAKRGKGSLFDKNKIDELLSQINADKVIEAVNTYHDISSVLTMYRKTRRNDEKTEFSSYLGISQQELLDHIDEYRFMNTGDILLLNVVSNLKRHYEKLGLQNITIKDLIIDSINIVKGIASKSSVTNMAAFTKNTSVFSEAQTKVSKLNQRYAIEQEEASTMCY